MYTLAIAGSTKRTTQVAETLFKGARFQISLVITPSPRKVGREQEILENPLHTFAQTNHLPTVLIDKSLDASIEEQVKKHFAKTPFDFLLVIDFGFLVPTWLLKLPKIAPLNIHPSQLPRWRGSSPGQFVLLNGDQESAVTLMVMNEKMDEGPIIAQLPFAVNPTWTQIEYYQHSFELICQQLGDLIEQFAQGKLKAVAQPPQSPTPNADRLTKQAAFRLWAQIQQAIDHGTQAEALERACRAYYPWPKLWTLVPTAQGEKRLILHRCHLDQAGQLVLDEVQLEGKTKTSWSEVQAQIQ